MSSTPRSGRSGETRRDGGSGRDQIQGPNTGATEQTELDETESRTGETAL